jgi:MoaA/NifB/PqqE/SkfB family radical SAM enzyme
MLSLAVHEIQNIHFEITNKCNSRCPGCARTHNGETHPYLADKLMEWDIEKVKTIFPPELVSSKHFTLGGTVDEPFMNRHIFDICEYLIANGGHIEIFTNGGANTVETFTKLGKLSYDTQALSVKFSVDGFEDTNHLYRVNVDWNKIVENMTAYTQQQGRCEWQYLVFEHNEKSIQQAKELADKLKIPIVLRQNVRNIKPWTSYIKKKVEGKIVTEKFVVNPTTSKKHAHPETNKVSKWSTPENISEQDKADSIYCLMYHKKEVFIDWSGRLWPCCWFATDYHFEEDHVLQEMDTEYGEHWNSVHYHSIDEILNTPYYKELLVKSWMKDNKFHNEECFKKCGDFAKRQNYRYSAVE